MQKLTAMIFAGLFASGAATAEENFDFDQYDANADGYLTESEWSEAEQANVDFNTVDVNGDGYIEEAELNDGLFENDGGPISDYDASAAGERELDSQAVSTDESTETTTAVTTSAEGEPTSDPADDTSMESDSQLVTETPVYTESSSGVSGETDTSTPSDPATEDDYTNTSTDPTSMQQSQGQSVDDLDSNSDGRVSREEAQQDRELVTYFVIWDVNQDGYLDQAEVDQGRQGSASGNDASSGDYRNSSQQDDSNTSDRPVEFDEHDIDGDGRLSEDESSAQYDSASFDTMDSNRDGYLDEAEVNYDPEARTDAADDSSESEETESAPENDEDWQL